jgi:uncharacterized membrane protein YkoI
MRSLLVITVSTLLIALAPAAAQPSGEDLLPLQRIIAIATERYQGEVVAAEVKPGKPHEQAAFVYELRLLTARNNVLRIRIDAGSGAFLEIDGRGQVDARRPPDDAAR